MHLFLLFLFKTVLMKPPISLLILSFFLSTQMLSGQDVAPFQMDDYEALVINSKVKTRLIGKKWMVLDRTFILKDHVQVVPVHKQSIEFQKGGTCLLNEQTTGSWDNYGENLIKVHAQVEKEADKNKMVLGGFAIYELTEESLVLGKVLTSNYNNKLIYQLVPEEVYFEEVQRRRKARKESWTIDDPIPDLSNETISGGFGDEVKAKEKVDGNYDTNSDKGKSKKQLIQEIRQEAFMRNLKLKEDLPSLEKTTLIKLKKRIIDNTYQD